MRPLLRLPAWSVALLLFAASFLLLDVCVGLPPLHEDTARDLLIARDCVDAGRCAMAGPTASFGGLTQGGLWIHVLEVSRAAGLGLGGVRALVLVLASVAAVLIAFTPGRLLRWNAGPAAWAIAMAATVWTIELPILWNPSALPLPIALFWIALLASAANGGLVSAAAVGVALSLSIDAHVVCVGLVPFALGVLVATGARPVVATLLAATLLVATSLLSSSGAVTADFPILAARWLPAAVLVTVALSVGLALRGRAKAASSVVRARGVLVAGCGYVAVAAFLASVVTGHGLAPRYLAPIVPAAAILAAGIATSGFDRKHAGPRRALMVNVVVVLAVALLVFSARRPAETRPRWTALDAEALAPSLAARGWTFGDLYQHQRGPEAHTLLAALAPYLPAPDGTPHLRAQDDLLLLKATRARVHASGVDESIVATLPGEGVAVGRRAPSWLDASALDVCAGPAGSDALRCVHTDLGQDDPDRDAHGTFSQRAYPELEDVRRAFLSGEGKLTGASRWTLAARLRAHEDEPAHVLTLPDSDPGWRIERIDGARYQGSLPSREVTLQQATGAGRIVFAVDVPAEGAGRFRPWLPSMIETTADEVSLRELSAEGHGGPR